MFANVVQVVGLGLHQLKASTWWGTIQWCLALVVWHFMWLRSQIGTRRWVLWKKFHRLSRYTTTVVHIAFGETTKVTNMVWDILPRQKDTPVLRSQGKPIHGCDWPAGVARAGRDLKTTLSSWSHHSAVHRRFISKHRLDSDRNALHERRFHQRSTVAQ